MSISQAPPLSRLGQTAFSRKKSQAPRRLSPHRPALSFPGLPFSGDRPIVSLTAARMHFSEFSAALPTPNFSEAVLRRQETMFDFNTQATTTTGEERLPIATFNNSLRQWQA